MSRLLLDGSRDIKVNKMKTKGIMNLDCRVAENKDKLQKALHNIKFFQDIEGDVPLVKIEKYIGLVQRKYAIQIDYVAPTFVPGEINLYSATVRKTYETIEKAYCDVVYATELYELFAKIAVLYYSLTNPKKEYPLADWDGEAKRRVVKLERAKKENWD